MKSFSAILRAYVSIDGRLAREEAAASNARDRKRLAGMRILNDQAYFVIIFAQFEDYIKNRCRRLIDRKTSSPNWVLRRAWDLIDVNRLSFMRQVALLIDRASADYGKVKSYYDIRCDIAHGTVYSAMPIAVPHAASDFQSISRRVMRRV
ncbi:MAG: hypothetical protein RIC55_03920 [Pirellulaceae bacterium]